MPTAAHLVGSLNVPDARTAFELAARHAGDVLARFPDGEPGARQGWIVAQIAVLSQVAELELVSRPRGPHDDWLPDEGLIWFRLRGGADAGAVEIGPLGYVEAALASFEIFKELQDGGTIRPEARMQVSLPTPWAIVNAYLHPSDQLAVEPAVKRAMHAEVDALMAALPHERLALQWDVAVEVTNLEGVFPVPFAPVREGTVERLTDAAGWVADDVPVGFHLCYGDAGGVHIIQPRDLGILVELTNAVVGGSARSIDWVHMPVPIERDDDAYFQPLDTLSIGDSELFLGLLHKEDGVAGAERRIRAAQRHVEHFGVATECGLARDAGPDDIPALLALHREAATMAVRAPR